MHNFLVFDKPIVYHLENDKQADELCSFGGQFCQDLETLTKTVLYFHSRLIEDSLLLTTTFLH